MFENLTFAAGSGELIELRGPNGAGKSSLLRLLAGLDAPAAGQLEISGDSIYVGHADAIKLPLTVSENLSFWRDCFGSGDVPAALRAFHLEALADDPAYLLSQGQKRRLALARLALVDRSLWLLDEPTVGLDTAALENLRTLMKTHLAGGGTIIAATHAALEIDATRTLTLGTLGPHH